MKKFNVMPTVDCTYYVVRWNDMEGQYEPLDNKEYSTKEAAEKVAQQAQTMYDEGMRDSRRICHQRE